MTITAATLQTWAQAIARWPSGGRSEATALVGGTLRVESADFASVVPVPAGATAIRIYDDRATHTLLAYLEIELEVPGMALEELEATFGAGAASPRTSATAPHKIRFRIDPPDTASTCDVYASFDGKPTPTSRSRSIMVRRNNR